MASNHLRALNLMILILAVLTATPATAGPSGPEVVIQRFCNSLMTSMQRAAELGYQGRYQLLEPEVKSSFALGFMGEKSVGSYWKDLDAKQRRRYLETYTTWSVAHYAHRFDSYSGQRFEVLPAAEQNARTVTIVSRLISSDAEAVDFHYKLRSIGNKWQIVDIQIEGVSQLALTRGQFVGILSRGGFDALISKLTDKIKAFERPSAP